MSRIETIGDATLYLGDCYDILPTLGLDVVTVTDPPYGIGYRHGKVSTGKWSSKHHEQRIRGDRDPFDPRPIIGRSLEIVLWGANNFSDLLPRGSWLVWDKRDGIENVKFSMSEAELAWKSDKCPAAIRVFRNLWFGLARSGEIGEHYHPTQKPVALMRWCIEQLTKTYPTITDPFMGSGTTGVAAVELGRKFTGVEVEEKYFDIACRRIEDAYKRPSMFIERPHFREAEQITACEPDLFE